MEILLIDDEESVATAISEYLSLRQAYDKSVFHTTFFNSCNEALDDLGRSDNIIKRYDCILLDWVLRQSKSGQCIPRLRELAPFTGIIVITGYEEIEYAIKSFRSGADDFVQKTQITKQLVESINEVVKFRRKRFDDYNVIGARLEEIEKLTTTVASGIQDIKAMRARQGGIK